MPHRATYNMKREWENTLSETRTAAGLTEKELAKIIDCSPALIQNLAKGITSPITRDGQVKEIVLRICQYFNATLAEMFPRYVCDMIRGEATDDQIIDGLFKKKIHRSPEEILEEKELKRLISHLFRNALTPQEESVIRMYFGFGALEEMSTYQIAVIKEMSTQGIFNILNRSCKKLKKPLEEYMKAKYKTPPKMVGGPNSQSGTVNQHL